jgi:hypothetical protein
MIRRKYKPNDRGLMCPDCHEQQIIESNQDMFDNGTGTCRYCWFKAPMYVFREAFQNKQDHVPEYDACYDENGYY